MEKTRRNYRTQTYIDGNTVRKLEAAPDYRREQEEKQREEIRQRNRRMAQKNQEKSAHMDLGYVAFYLYRCWLCVWQQCCISVCSLELQRI